MQDFAIKFYSSGAGKKCREAYKKSVGGMCERCLKKGLYNPAVIVHHKCYLTPENIEDPRITLCFDNLEALCTKCHNEEHNGEERRYTIDEMGRVSVL